MKALLKYFTLSILALTAFTGYQIHHLTVISAEQQKQIDKLQIAVDQSAEETAKLLSK